MKFFIGTLIFLYLGIMENMFAIFLKLKQTIIENLNSLIKWHGLLNYNNFILLNHFDTHFVLIYFCCFVCRILTVSN